MKEYVTVPQTRIGRDYNEASGNRAQRESAMFGFLRAACLLAACFVANACSGSGPETTERTATAAQAVTPPPSATPWLVVLCKAADYQQVPTGDDQAFYTKMFATAGTGGMNDFWSQISAGNVNLQGTVVTNWTFVPGSTSAAAKPPASDQRRWLQIPGTQNGQPLPLTNPNVVQSCVNTQSGRSDFASFYNYIALWNVIVGAEGGFTVTIAGKSLSGVKIDVGSGPGLIQHEMAHGYTFDHSFNDAFSSGGCTGDGRAGAYLDPNDIMSWQCNSPTHTGTLCVNAWENNTPAPDCNNGPGMTLWNLFNMNWGTSNTSKGYPGTGIATTPSWPNSYNNTILIAPRSRPDINASRGIYVRAHEEYGYMVELDAPSNWDQNVPNALTVHRVFYNNPTPYLVAQSGEIGGTQSNDFLAFTETNEGSLYIGMTSNPTATAATVQVVYSPGPAVWWGTDYGYPTVNNPTLGDWAPGNYKGQCWPGQGIIGVSKSISGIQSHGMQCGPRTLGLDTNGTWGTGANVRPMNNYSNQCADTTWDWDPGSYKDECCANEVVEGISQDQSGNLSSILCAAPNVGTPVGHKNCGVQVFYNNDSPAFSGYDWDPGYYKGQCPAGQYVAGISTPAFASIGVTGAAHAILCCSP
jgi:hypothetical protein